MSEGTGQKLTKQPSGEAALARQIEQAFDQPIPRSRLSIFYQFALLITTLLVVALPLIYLAIIVALGYGVYQYAIHGLEWVGMNGDGASGTGARFKLFAYIAPLGIGVTLIGFMIKPFLAPRVDQVIGPTLTHDDQPLLFDFVERLCDKLGAPVPKRIEVMADVNASASFRRGWLSFFGRDLVLRIGLPLAGGLTVRQLGGIIAHEFGHFRQATAMRMDYMTRSVNHWFARVVYTRDGWDQALAEGMNSGIGYVMIFCALMQLAVWLTRRILWILMIVAHGVSCFMSRQMEYDADRAFAVIAGGEAVGPTLTRAQLLGMMFDNALNKQGDGMSSKDLFDNLPEYVVKSVRLVSADQNKQLADALMQEPTGLFDTHPSLKRRVERAAVLEAPGVLSIDSPSAGLFRNFRTLSKAVTYAFYRHHLDDRLELYNLVKTDSAIGELEERGDRVGMFQRYLGNYITDRPPRIVLDPPKAPANPKQMLETLKAARTAVAKQRGMVKETLEKAAAAEQEYMSATVYHAWSRFATAEMRKQAPEEMRSPESTQALAQKAESELATHRAKLKKLDAAVNQRLDSALQLLMVPELSRVIPDTESHRRNAVKQAATLSALARYQPQMVRMDIQRGVLTGWLQAQQALGDNLDAKRFGSRLIRQLREEVNTLTTATQSLMSNTPSGPEPGGDDDGYALDERQYAAAEHGGSVGMVDFETLDKLVALYDDSLGSLVSTAELVETHLKLPALFEGA